MAGITEYYILLRQLIHNNLQVPVYSESTFENQNVDVPCVVFSRDNTIGTQTMDGPSVRFETVTFDCKAKTIQEAEDMRTYIISLLNGYDSEIQIVLNSSVDEFDILTGLYSRQISFTVTWNADIEYVQVLTGAGSAGQVSIYKAPYILTGSNAMIITGSNINFAGDVNISGSLTIGGGIVIENAVSASYARNADTASYLLGSSLTSSYALYAVTASYALNSVAGTSGTSGANGSSGTSGANGSSGTSGQNGSSGTSGANGANGSSGTSGANGVNGSSGTSGVSGANGSSGTSGLNGSSGTSGTSGANGSIYVASSTTNMSIVPSGSVVNMTVETGLAYTPTQDVTIVYDYNNHMHGIIYSYNSGTGALVVNITDYQGSGTYNSWTVNLEGAVGAVGSSGSSGVSGASGSSGTSGASGSSGTSGQSGSSGTSGASGSSGTSGVSGTTITSGSYFDISSSYSYTSSFIDGVRFQDTLSSSYFGKNFPVNGTGVNNTVVGNNSANSLTTGTSNVLVGTNVGSGLTTAASNILVGVGVGRNLTTGGSNTVVGRDALVRSVTGTNNVAIGESSLRAGTPTSNTAVGLSTLISGSGANNVALGIYAGTGRHLSSPYTESVTTGANNTFLGAQSGVASGSGAISNAVAIGYQAIVDASNKVVIGGTAITSTLIRGNVTQSNTNVQGNLIVDNSLTAANASITSITGSLFGTSSYAITASYALNGGGTATLPANVVSSSAQLSNNGGVAFTNSNNVTFGQVTASAANLSVITASYMYASGSNIFGDSTNDIHTFVGRVDVTGSIRIVSGSLVGTASHAIYAETASYAINTNVSGTPSSLAIFASTNVLTTGTIIQVDDGQFATTGSTNAELDLISQDPSSSISTSRLYLSNDTNYPNTSSLGILKFSPSYDQPESYLGVSASAHTFIVDDTSQKLVIGLLSTGSIIFGVNNTSSVIINETGLVGTSSFAVTASYALNAGGTGNLDGGFPDTNYGGSTPIDGGTV
jgi:hypothetical protein